MKSNNLSERIGLMLMIALGSMLLYSIFHFAYASNSQSGNMWHKKAATVTVYVAQSYICQDDDGTGNCNLLRSTGGSSRDTLIMYNSSEKSVYLYVADKEGLRNRDRAGVFKEYVFLKKNRRNTAYKLRNVYKL